MLGYVVRLSASIPPLLLCYERITRQARYLGRPANGDTATIAATHVCYECTTRQARYLESPVQPGCK